MDEAGRAGFRGYWLRKDLGFYLEGMALGRARTQGLCALLTASSSGCGRTDRGGWGGVGRRDLPGGDRGVPTLSRGKWVRNVC